MSAIVIAHLQEVQAETRLKVLLTHALLALVHQARLKVARRRAKNRTYAKRYRQKRSGEQKLEPCTFKS